MRLFISSVGVWWVELSISVKLLQRTENWKMDIGHWIEVWMGNFSEETVFKDLELRRKMIFLENTKSGLFGKFLLGKISCGQDYEECCIRHMSKKFRFDCMYRSRQRHDFGSFKTFKWMVLNWDSQFCPQGIFGNVTSGGGRCYWRLVDGGGQECYETSYNRAAPP